jgi:hypothetical protein
MASAVPRFLLPASVLLALLNLPAAVEENVVESGAATALLEFKRKLMNVDNHLFYLGQHGRGPVRVGQRCVLQ